MMATVGRGKVSYSHLRAWNWILQPVIHCCKGIWHVRRTLGAATAVYVFVFCVLLPFWCSDLPYCKLYRNRLWDFQTALKYNSVRVKRAEELVRTLDEGKTKALYQHHGGKSSPRFAIGVITTRRGPSGEGAGPKPKYLTQVMAQLHDVLTAEGASPKTALFMCNVDAVPKAHKEFQELSGYFPSRNKYESSDPAFSFVGKHEKEKVDYAYCLVEALRFKPEYVILVEDDAYPHADFPRVLEHILKTKLETAIRTGEPTTPSKEEWMWLKLNFPDNLSFFERNWYFAIEWVSLSLFISGTFAASLHIAHHCKLVGKGSEGTSTGHTSWLYLVFVLSFLLVFVSLLVLERPYFTRLRGLSTHFYALGPGTSCCTPAVLFPAGQVPYVVGYLKHIRCSRLFPLDMALEDYRLKRGLRQFLISPNLFRHIGMYSSIRGIYDQKGASKYLFLE